MGREQADDTRLAWGPRRIAGELHRRGASLRHETAVYRCMVRAGVIDPAKRHRRKEIWKRWERARAMELWQMDVVGGFLLADGTTAKALTGIDDHSRFCVSARLMTTAGCGPGGTFLNEEHERDRAEIPGSPRRSG
ncbi:MAG: hypothetical protein NVS3B24_20430 [Candidatus Dormibacteria bacterium]